MSNIVFDHFGHAIRKGDVVNYPVRAGASMWISSARVDSVNSDDSLSVTTITGKRAKVTNIDNCILASKSVKRDVRKAIRAIS